MDVTHTNETTEGGKKQPPLLPVIGRPKLKDYIVQLWSRRYFIVAEARAKAYAQDGSMFLGQLWLLLSPALDVAVYGLVFGVILHASRGVSYYITFLFVGITFFGFMSGALIGGCNLIQNNKAVIRGFSFPRASLVLSFTLTGLFQSLPVIFVTLVIIAFIPGGPPITATWLWFIPVYMLQILFQAGMTFLTAWGTHIVPDLSRVLKYASRIWFYGSGVFYSIDKMVTDPTLLAILRANPGYQAIELSRNALIYNKPPEVGELAEFAAWGVGLFVIGFLLFWTREVKYARSY